ncbi:MAG TPA: ABC transporter permease [Jiangellaceae bacterium]|nr:ABC transporter permease [Jiangellaceae bacterium]
MRYEWMRIRTLRSTYWLTGLAILVTAGIALIIAMVTRDDPITPEIAANVLLGGGEFATFIPVFMAIMGILAVGHEYRYGTIQPTLMAVPQRSRLLTAKIVVVCLVTLAVVVVSLVINAAIGTIFWGELPDLTTEPLNEVIPGYVVMVLLWTLLGIALAQLFRGVPSAIVVLLVTPLIVESLIMGLAMIPALDWLVPVVKYLPFNAGSRLIATGPPDMGPGAPDFNLFDRWPSGGVFAVFIAIILAVAWYRFQTKDA